MNPQSTPKPFYKSRKFWAAIGKGVVAFIGVQYPQYQEAAEKMVWGLIAYIFGTAYEDAHKTTAVSLEAENLKVESVGDR